MTLSDARRHSAHLCDAFSGSYANNDEHIGVISRIRAGRMAEPMAFVSGHPQYVGRWVKIGELSTACKIAD